ncbi:MAG: SCO1664 family protein [Actinobacteria bacterium]|uniref:Unannotated protein n=1 Tax=freshwater metagenome TaxID=449393 RepID=A0A6J6BB55_9ZZZZ|nr:SCO1664 family protein [Actinomycetota bacterium]MTA20762.1 SCO1664 family protein [Actinomycetota bacterium]
MKSAAEILGEGIVRVEGRLVDASNATLFAALELDGQSVRAIYKPISGERPLWDFQSGTLAFRERAAYLISEAMGCDLVPLTILRDGPFGEGSFQLWIDIDESVDLALYFRETHPNLRKVALFDAVINNTDRKIGHLLPTESGHLYVCDHGVTFHEEDKLRTVLWQWSGQPLNKDELEMLKSLHVKISEFTIEELSGLLNEVEIKALLMRVDRLISEATFPEPNPDWPAVPWPPF